MPRVHHGTSRATFARPLLHQVHTFAFLTLLTTGLLLFVPELRALATGGYSLLIRRIHVWTGAASLALPAAVMVYLGAVSALAPSPAHSFRSLLKALHQALTVAITLVFAATGLVLWSRNPIYESIEDPSRLVHEWLMYGSAALLTVHLIDVMVIGPIVRMRMAGAPTAKPSQ